MRVTLMQHRRDELVGHGFTSNQGAHRGEKSFVASGRARQTRSSKLPRRRSGFRQRAQPPVERLNFDRVRLAPHFAEDDSGGFDGPGRPSLYEKPERREAPAPNLGDRRPRVVILRGWNAE